MPLIPSGATEVHKSTIASLARFMGRKVIMTTQMGNSYQCYINGFVIVDGRLRIVMHYRRMTAVWDADWYHHDGVNASALTFREDD